MNIHPIVCRSNFSHELQFCGISFSVLSSPNLQMFDWCWRWLWVLCSRLLYNITPQPRGARLRNHLSISFNISIYMPLLIQQTVGDEANKMEWTFLTHFLIYVLNMAEGNSLLHPHSSSSVASPSSLHSLSRLLMGFLCVLVDALSLHNMEDVGNINFKLTLQLVWCANDSHLFASYTVTLRSINPLYRFPLPCPVRDHPLPITIHH